MKTTRIISLLLLAMILLCSCSNGSETSAADGVENNNRAEATENTGDASSEETEEISFFQNAFMLSEDGTHYAVFDIEGNRLTDYIYGCGGAYGFINNAIYTYILDDGRNIILDNTGKELFSTKSISRLSSTYYCSDENSDSQFIDKNGNIVLDAESWKCINETASYCLLDIFYCEKDNTIKIANANGKITAEFVKKDDYNLIESRYYPTIVQNDGKSYLINTVNGEIEDIIDGYYKCYASNFNVIGGDVDDFVLKSDNSFRYYEDYKFEHEFQTDEYNNVYMKEDATYPLYLYVKGEGYYYYNSVTDKVIAENEIPKAWIDNDNYVLYDSTSKIYTFYVNNKATGTLPESTYYYIKQGSVKNKTYLLEGTADGLTYVANADGTLVSQKGIKGLMAYKMDYDFGWYVSGSKSAGGYSDGTFYDAQLNPIEERAGKYLYEYTYNGYEFMLVCGDAENSEISQRRLYDSNGKLLLTADTITVPELHSDRHKDPYLIVVKEGVKYIYSLSGKEIMAYQNN